MLNARPSSWPHGSGVATPRQETAVVASLGGPSVTERASASRQAAQVPCVATSRSVDAALRFFAYVGSLLASRPCQACVSVHPTSSPIQSTRLRLYHAESGCAVGDPCEREAPLQSRLRDCPSVRSSPLEMTSILRSQYAPVRAIGLDSRRSGNTLSIRNKPPSGRIAVRHARKMAVARVIPVVDDALQHVHITARWHRSEEVATFELHRAWTPASMSTRSASATT